MIDDLKQYEEPDYERRRLVIFREIFGNLAKDGINGDREKTRLKIMSGRLNDFAEMVRSGFAINEQHKIMNALYMMLGLHTGQIDRKEGGPSICHPLQVGDDIPRRYGMMDADLCITGLLHDSVEDQGEAISRNREKRLNRKLGNDIRTNALDELEYFFGERVRKALEGLSNPDFKSGARELKSKGAVAPVRELKHHLYKEHIKEIIGNPDIFLAKFADIMRNYTMMKAIEKYRPVIDKVFRPALEKMGRSHFLYNCREKMFQQMEKAVVL